MANDLNKRVQRTAQDLIRQSQDTSALLAIQSVQSQLNALSILVSKLQATAQPEPGVTSLGYDNIRPLIADLINKTGRAVYYGDVLVVDTASTDGVKTTITRCDPRFAGVVAGDGRLSTVGNSAQYVSAAGLIGSHIAVNVGGVCSLKVTTKSGRQSVKAGDFLVTASGRSGYAEVAVMDGSGRTTDKSIIAMALEAQSANIDGIIDALLMPNPAYDTSSSIDVFGLKHKTIVVGDSPYTAALFPVILANATGGNIAVNLPAAATVNNRIYHIKKTDSSANTVTIDGASSETIDGETTIVIATQYASVMIICDGTGWHII